MAHLLRKGGLDRGEVRVFWRCLHQSFWPMIVLCRECNSLCQVREDAQEVRQAVGRLWLPHFLPTKGSWAWEQSGGRRGMVIGWWWGAGDRGVGGMGGTGMK